MRASRFVCLALLLPVWLMGCVKVEKLSEMDSPIPASGVKLVASEDVTAQDAERARALAEGQPILKASLRKERVVYVGTELMRIKTDAGEDSPEKIFRVFHYRYNDDAAIHSIVNLKRSAVLEQQEFPHLPTRLSQGEFDAAAAMALKDPKVREALGSDLERVKVEALVVRSTDAKDPWFGRRMVRLLFRVGRDYRRAPHVIIDLTNNIVLVDKEGER